MVCVCLISASWRQTCCYGQRRTVAVSSQTVKHTHCCVQGQLVGVALSFLRNFGILSGASGVLGALSSGVASAALDDRFAVQRAQQKQVSLLLH